MHRLFEDWLWVWNWLTKEGASRATVILVFITAWYTVLTYRMAKVMNRQTRAIVQPVVHVEFRVDKEEAYPKGSFTVKNLGTQPVILLDLRLESRREGLIVFEEYSMYERHIMPPADQIGFPFDFTRHYRDKGIQWWTPGVCSFTLDVVASDLSEDVVLTYSGSQFWRTLTVKKGMPLRVRWKFFYGHLRSRYYRILHIFRKPGSVFIEKEEPVSSDKYSLFYCLTETGWSPIEEGDTPDEWVRIYELKVYQGSAFGKESRHWQTPRTHPDWAESAADELEKKLPRPERSLEISPDFWKGLTK